MANVGKLVRFYDWKFNYLKSNGMLTCLLLSQDINALCELIDKNSDEGMQDSYDNFTINECLAYIRQSFLPVLLKQNAKILEEDMLQEALLNFIDIISIRCKSVSYFIIFRENLKTQLDQAKGFWGVRLPGDADARIHLNLSYLTWQYLARNSRTLNHQKQQEITKQESSNLPICKYFD